MEEIEAFVVLNHIPYLGPSKMQKLLTHFGTALNILTSPIEYLLSLIGEKDRSLPFLREWRALTTWKEDLFLVKKEGVKLLSFNDKDYPSSLKELKDPPFLLYIKGELKVEDQNSVGIVGTRNGSLYGKEMAEKFGYVCASLGFTVISGLARGVDSCAHRGALKGGRTIAVLGSGLLNIYPKENSSLAREIESKGAVISEFPMKTAPDKFHFPKRNRLVAALSHGMLLIEAPQKSGAMITLNYSLEQKKRCFTLSGRVDCETFSGNHFLIKEQKARLVENAQEMLSLLRPEYIGSPKTSISSTKNIFSLTQDEEMIMRFLKSEEIYIEELAALTKLGIAKLSSLLMGLVLKKIVREFPGKLYRKVM